MSNVPLRSMYSQLFEFDGICSKNGNLYLMLLLTCYFSPFVTQSSLLTCQLPSIPHNVYTQHSLKHNPPTKQLHIWLLHNTKRKWKPSKLMGAQPNEKFPTSKKTPKFPKHITSITICHMANLGQHPRQPPWHKHLHVQS